MPDTREMKFRVGDFDIEKVVMASATARRVEEFAKTVPFDAGGFEEGVRLCLIEITVAIEEGRIAFATDNEEAIMMGLLALILRFLVSRPDRDEGATQ